MIAANSENDAITSLKFSDSVKYIEDLGSMKQLEKLELPRSAKTIRNSFNNCENLKEVKLCRCDTVTDSFLSCPVLEKVKVRAVEDMEHSFCDCGMLKEVRFNGFHQLKNAFCDLDSLESVDFNYSCENIEGSFVRCPKLKKVTHDTEFTSVRDSFLECAEDLDIIYAPSEQIAEKADQILDSALNKLADSGAIPPLQTDEKNNILPQITEDGDMIFTDEKAEKTLTEKLTVKPEKIILISDDHKKCEWDEVKDVLADTTEDCGYIIYYRAYVTPATSYYHYAENIGSETRFTGKTHPTTTYVFVVDAQSEEIIHIHKVGLDWPEVPNQATGPYEYHGEVLAADAKEYILSLLK